MQYMLLCCIDETRWNALPQDTRDAVMRDYHGLIDELTAAGTYVSGGKLQDTVTATTVRSAGGRAVFTDGPFAETKEQLGGFHVVACRDLDEAMGIARRIPTLPVGGAVEIRPMATLQDAGLSIPAAAVRPEVSTTLTEDA